MVWLCCERCGDIPSCASSRSSSDRTRRPELVVKAAQAGVNNYLVKPFTAAILREKIEQVMGKLS